MRRRILAATAVASIALTGASVVSNDDKFIWNRTESAPTGLYWCLDRAPEKQEWAVVSAGAPSSIWIAERNYLAPGWPIIKRVAGVAGDKICRHGTMVKINNKRVATAMARDGEGRALPAWSGCFILAPNEFFLLNDHPKSLDGRYFGATKKEDVSGAARLLIRTGK